jgi:hypothetical protein
MSSVTTSHAGDWEVVRVLPDEGSEDGTNSFERIYRWARLINAYVGGRARQRRIWANLGMYLNACKKLGVT